MTAMKSLGAQARKTHMKRLLRLAGALTLLVAFVPPPLRAADNEPDWAQAAESDVSMASYSFMPSAIHLRRGQPYRLHFVNTSHSGHSFSSRTLFAAATVDPADAAKVSNGTVEVEGGQAVDVRVEVQKPGVYPFRCSHPLHSAFGMHGSVTVE
jgi:uncharacterized cupredoxin-like copper-binding protein